MAIRSRLRLAISFEDCHVTRARPLSFFSSTSPPLYPPETYSFPGSVLKTNRRLAIYKTYIIRDIEILFPSYCYQIIVVTSEKKKKLFLLFLYNLKSKEEESSV